MNKIDGICIRAKDWRAYTAAIALALLLVFPAVASTTTPQDIVSNDQEEKLITLNLRDVNIGVLINTVAEISGKNIIVDPRVQAKVTVVSETPLDAQQLYEVFLSVLEVHNLTVINADPTTIMIVPNDVIILDQVVQNWASAL